MQASWSADPVPVPQLFRQNIDRLKFAACRAVLVPAAPSCDKPPDITREIRDESPLIRQRVRQNVRPKCSAPLDAQAIQQTVADEPAVTRLPGKYVYASNIPGVGGYGEPDYHAKTVSETIARPWATRQDLFSPGTRYGQTDGDKGIYRQE